MSFSLKGIGQGKETGKVFSVAFFQCFLMITLKIECCFIIILWTLLVRLLNLILYGQTRQSQRKQSYNAIWKSYILDYQHNFPIFY